MEYICTLFLFQIEIVDRIQPASKLKDALHFVRKHYTSKSKETTELNVQSFSSCPEEGLYGYVDEYCSPRMKKIYRDQFLERISNTDFLKDQQTCW